MPPRASVQLSINSNKTGESPLELLPTYEMTTGMIFILFAWVCGSLWTRSRELGLDSLAASEELGTEFRYCINKEKSDKIVNKLRDLFCMYFFIYIAFDVVASV